MNQNFEIGAGLVFAFFYLAYIFARRQNLKHNLRYLLAAGGVALMAFAICKMTNDFQNYASFIGASAGLLTYRLRPRRKRRMTAETRRRVIAKWEYDTGKRYNSQKYEIDHIVPFSDGGSDTEDNLCVIEKGRNRSKSAQPARWDLLGHLLRRRR